MSDDIGIVCQECGNGRLHACDKVRRGDTIRRTYQCLNPTCPAILRGEVRIVYTTERFWHSRTRANNSTDRVKRTKVPATNQMQLPNAD